MILIAQSDRSTCSGALAQLLTERGHPVLMAHSTGEAYRMVKHMRPSLVVLDAPPVQRCPFVLCSLIRAGVESPPKMVALAEVPDPDQRERCRQCMTLLRPDAQPDAVAGVVETLVGPAASAAVSPCCVRRS